MGSGRFCDMTSRPTSDGTPGLGLEEREVADFLRRHPDFFERHLALLTELVVPHSGRTGAVSLLERQVTVLRDQLGAERGRLKLLMNAARENSRLQQRLQRCFQSIASACDLSDLARVVPEVLQKEFDLDSVVVKFLDTVVCTTAPVQALAAYSDETVQALIQRFQGNACLVEAPPSAEVMCHLPPASASRVGSCAVVPICNADQVLLGWVILAAHDSQRYRADMDTALLEGLGGLIGAACTRLNLP